MQATTPTKKRCLICDSTDLSVYLDLGTTVPANAFVQKKDLKKKEPRFPLRVFYCHQCHLAQLTDIVDRKKLFETYTYFSSASKPLERYFKDYAKAIHKRFPIQSKGFVVEIGSNDGILLRYFKSYTKQLLGIDPAKNIVSLATKNGIHTLPVFFNLPTARKILKNNGKASLIIANHVLAHTDQIHSVIQGVQELLAENGIFVFEVQYVADLLQKNQFDNTYHEHISYFSLAPLQTLLRTHGLDICTVERVRAQGGSIRVYAGHMPLVFPIDSGVQKLLAQEKKSGLHRLSTYKTFGKKPEKIKKDLVTLLQKLKKQNKKIVGYGASAKGNTLLQYCGIGPDLIDYIVDTTPSKQGKFTPGTHIPVYPPEHLKKNVPDYVLILTWNYADVIIEKEKALRKKGVKFIIPVPAIKVI